MESYRNGKTPYPLKDCDIYSISVWTDSRAGRRNALTGGSVWLGYYVSWYVNKNGFCDFANETFCHMKDVLDFLKRNGASSQQIAECMAKCKIINQQHKGERRVRC